MTDYTKLVEDLRDIKKTMFALGTSPINMDNVPIRLAYDKKWGRTANDAAAAIEALNRLVDLNTQRCEELRKQLREAHESYERHLNELVAQLPKRGKWIGRQNHKKCSVCGKQAIYDVALYTDMKTPYCPHCGAKMEDA